MFKGNLRCVSLNPNGTFIPALIQSPPRSRDSVLTPISDTAMTALAPTAQGPKASPMELPLDGIFCKQETPLANKLGKWGAK